MLVYPVSNITNYLRELLESDVHLADLWVSGEVSSVTRSAAGHLYFTLKDADAQLRCAFLRGASVQGDPTPLVQSGTQVLAHGRISLYEVRGDLQFYVDFVQPEDQGDDALAGGFLQPGRPYSNLRQVRQLLTRLSGDIYWVDRHLDVTTLDVIADAVTEGKQASFALVREGIPHERLRRQATSLRRELRQLGIELDVRCFPADSGAIHDRWIVSAEGVWTLPPTAAMGRAGELTPSSDPEAVRKLALKLYTEAKSIFAS